MNARAGGIVARTQGVIRAVNGCTHLGDAIVWLGRVNTLAVAVLLGSLLVATCMSGCGATPQQRLYNAWASHATARSTLNIFAEEGKISPEDQLLIDVYLDLWEAALETLDKAQQMGTELQFADVMQLVTTLAFRVSFAIDRLNRGEPSGLDPPPASELAPVNSGDVTITIEEAVLWQRCSPPLASSLLPSAA